MSVVVYRRGDEEIVFTFADGTLAEHWGDETHHATFRSPLLEDAPMRMRHRDEALRGWGFVADRPWTDLFEGLDETPDME